MVEKYEERLEIVKSIISKEATIRGTAREKGIDKNVIKFWLKSYEYHQEEGLKYRKKNYTDKEKSETIKYYKEHEISLIDCAAKHALTNPSTLRKWLREEKKI